MVPQIIKKSQRLHEGVIKNQYKKQEHEDVPFCKLASLNATPETRKGNFSKHAFGSAGDDNQLPSGCTKICGRVWAYVSNLRLRKRERCQTYCNHASALLPTGSCLCGSPHNAINCKHGLSLRHHICHVTVCFRWRGKEIIVRGKNASPRQGC